MAENTPLHHAVDVGNVEMVEALIKKNADVNAKDGQGLTSFALAVGWGRVAVLEALLEKRISVLATDDQKNNVLHICGATGHEEILKILHKRFPDVINKLVTAKNAYGWTPLDFSFRCGHLEVTKILVALVLKASPPPSYKIRADSQTFVHTRFSLTRKDELNFKESSTCRFVHADSDRTIYRVPRCKWYIQVADKDEYEETRRHVVRFEEKLRWYLAKH